MRGDGGDLRLELADLTYILLSLVFGHLLHVSCASRCEAHVLNVAWLEKAIAEDNEVSSKHASERDFGEEAETESVAGIPSPATYPTRVLPVFVLPPDARKAASDGGTQECKSSGGTGEASAALSGVAVVQDAMLGHVALFRSTSGVVSAVNLTVHTKLCDLHESTRVSLSSYNYLFSN
jgi:hypothetical protein